MSDHQIIIMLCLGYIVMGVLHLITLWNMRTQRKWQTLQDKAILDLMNREIENLKNLFPNEYHKSEG